MLPAVSRTLTGLTGTAVPAVTSAIAASLAGLASFWATAGQFRGWWAAGSVEAPAGRDGPCDYLGWKRIPPSKRMTSAFM